MAMQLRKQAFSGIKWTTLSSSVTTALSIIQLAYLGRVLLPADFGLMAMIMVVIGFAQAFADMGISNAIIHYQNEDRKQLSSLYWLNIISGAIIFVLIVAVKPLIAAFYHEPRLDSLIFLASFIFLITPIGQQSQILLQRELKFNELAFAEIFSSAAGLGAAVFSAHAGYGVVSLVLGQLANTLVRTLLITYVGFRRWRPLFHFKRSDLKGYVSFGLYQMGERSINYLGGNLDKLLIGRLLGAQSLGYYNIAYQLMTKPIAIFNPIITRVAFPLFAKIQHDDVRLRSGYLDAIRIIAFALFPIYTGMILLAKPFIIVLVGENWLPAVVIFQILCILGYFFSLGNPLGGLLLAKGRADLGFFFNVLMILLYGTAIWFGSRFGLNGIATSLVLSTALVLFPIGFGLRWKLVNLHPVEYVNAFLPMLAGSLVMGVALHYLGVFMLTDYTITAQLLFSTGIGALIYIAIMYWWQKQTFIRIVKGSL
jgi:O-antigen/teichoic acid export membrane protein